MQRTGFNQSVIDKLNYYVYCLVDPRNNRIFYIGKGHGNRVFQHALCAMTSTDETLKLQIIREIIQDGREVKHYIIRHNLTDEQAYIVESTLIDLLTFHDFNLESVLTNIQAGHHQWDEGIKSTEEINALYDCEPLTTFGKDRLMAVKLNRTYQPKGDVEEVYKRENMYGHNPQIMSWPYMRELSVPFSNRINGMLSKNPNCLQGHVTPLRVKKSLILHT